MSDNETIPSAVEAMHAGLQHTLEAIDKAVSLLQKAGELSLESAMMHQEAVKGSTNPLTLQIIEGRQQVQSEALEKLSPIFLAASLITQADNTLMGGFTPEAGPAATPPHTEPVPDPTLQAVKGSRPIHANEEAWYEGDVLSDPSQVTYPTSVGEHPSGVIDLEVAEAVRISGRIDGQQLAEIDLGSYENNTKVGVAAYAIQTFIREATRRGVTSAEAHIVNERVARYVVRLVGADNILLNNAPATAEDIIEGSKGLGSSIKIDLTTPRVRKLIERRKR